MRLDLVAVLVLLGCSAEQPSTRTASPDFAAAPPSAPALSHFSVPLEYDAAAVLRLVEEAVPHTFGSMDSIRPVDGDSRKHYAFEAARGPFTAFARGREMHLRATLAYEARGYYKPPIAPTISAGCGGGRKRPRILVELATPLGLTPDWHLTAHTRIVTVRPASGAQRDRCDVGILHTDVTDRVVGAARSALADRLGAIDRRVGRLDLGERVAEWWSLLQRPIRLADGIWLAVQPERLRMGDVSGEALVLTVPVSLDARPRIVTGDAPPTPRSPPPPLARDSVGDGFHIVMDGLVDFGTASRAVSDALAGRQLTRAGRSVTVQHATVQPLTRGRIGLSLSFAGDANGHLRLAGTPRYDARLRQVRVPDLDYDLDTDDPLVNAYAWLRSDDLRSMLRDRARLPVDSALSRGRNLLLDGLNRQLGESLTLSATVDSLAVTGLYVTRDGLIVRADATGRARVAVRPR